MHCVAKEPEQEAQVGWQKMQEFYIGFIDLPMGQVLTQDVISRINCWFLSQDKQFKLDGP
jgi:hypothetical protein